MDDNSENEPPADTEDPPLTPHGRSYYGDPALDTSLHATEILNASSEPGSVLNGVNPTFPTSRPHFFQPIKSLPF